MRFHRGFLVVAACLALAAPVASARPVEQFLDPSACDAACEAQVLASRGKGAPVKPEPAANEAPSLPSADSGFDAASAAAGAAVAGLIGVAMWSLVASSRRRVRTARP